MKEYLELEQVESVSELRAILDHIREEIEYLQKVRNGTLSDSYKEHTDLEERIKREIDQRIIFLFKPKKKL